MLSAPSNSIPESRMPVTQHTFVTFGKSTVSLTFGPFAILLLRVDDVARRQTKREHQEAYVDSVSGGILGSVPVIILTVGSFCIVHSRIFFQVCESCDESRTIANRDLQSSTRASNIMRSEVVCEPERVSKDGFPKRSIRRICCTRPWTQESSGKRLQSSSASLTYSQTSQPGYVMAPRTGSLANEA